MDVNIFGMFKFPSDFALEVWFSIFAKELISRLNRTDLHAFHDNPDRIYLNSRRFSQKCRMRLSSAEIVEASSTNSEDPDQTAPVRAD